MTSPTAPLSADSRKKARVMIVDDEGFARLLLKSALAEENYQVLEAQDGLLALEQVRADPEGLDILITDLNMPGMGGRELVQTLRREGCRVAIIVLSGNDDVRTTIGVMHDGADDYLLKDENIEETVLFAVKKLLDKRAMERENRLLLEAVQKANQELGDELCRRQQHEAQIQRDYHSRTAINRLLELSMTGQALEQQLAAMLDTIISVPWFALQNRGALFLVEESTGDLVLKANQGLSKAQQASCARVPARIFQQALCGRAMESGEVFFVPPDALEAGQRCTGLLDCGRYILPIRLHHRTIGVVKLYTALGHQPETEGITFLQTVASTLASVMERQRLEEALKQKAEYDPLTGFANRALFYDRLTQAISAARRTDKDLVLIFIDLDRFKQVNDTLGHEAGDRLLQEASRRIAGCLRNTDLLARLGGDEFTIILPWLTHAFYVEYVARRILEELNKPFFLPQGEASVSGSLGITFFPHDADEMEQLLKNADAAMYQAKEAGRSTFRFFTPAMNEAAEERLLMERALIQAWDNREFVLHYQPRVGAVTRRPVGVEVQLCWHRPGEGLVLPQRFGPHLEQTDLVVPLGLWMLETACQQYKSWLAAGLPLRSLTLPLSARQLQQGKTLVAMVEAVLAAVELPPAQLVLEVSGTELMSQWDKTRPLLQALRVVGVNLAIRDIGSAPFSPAFLQSISICAIKLDEKLLPDGDPEPGRVVLLQGIIDLAKRLEWTVVAGVKNELMTVFSSSAGCDELQGPCFSNGMAADACTHYLSQWG